MFVLWRLNVGEQSPLKTGAQAVLQAVNGLWWAITGHDNLLIGIVEGIEGVKEFFFSRLFPGNELNIVHKQDIDLAVLCPELFGLLETNSVNDFVCEFFRSDVEDMESSRLPDVSNRMQQVGFSQANAPIEKERIVNAPWIFRDG